MVLRGLESRHEQDPTQLIRDVRTLGQRIRDFFKDARNAAMVLIALAASAFFFEGIVDFIFVFAVGIFIYSYTRKAMLPFRMPKRAKRKDYNDLKPDGKTPKMAGGICYYGNEKNTNEELWFNNEDMRTHTLIFGSTGSGKTETLISLAYNALLFGSGFIYVDGKGDNTLFSKIFSMARALGREDDVLLVNFMTGARDIVGPQEHRLSNTLNPFANGSSSMLSQLIVSMMASASQSPDGDMWKNRAISFVEALMKPLVYMRDQGKILLDANVIRNYFELDLLESIVIDKVFPRRGQESVSLADAPPTVFEPLYNYVVNLPGYNKEKKGQQVSQVLEQHGFITMQLVRVFTSLADTYGHILRTNLAEVDLKDVVLNRRILVVLLPALEKSPDELSNLGKVIIASLKAMMAAGLGEEVEGEYKDIVLRKPTNAPTPYMCILDEYGYYAVEGFAVVPAQARSLGFSVVFAGQDLPAFQKASKEEAASIGANTNIKIAMKLEDPVETWEFFSKTAGEAFVTKVDSFQTNAQSVTNTYLDARSASSERRARVDLLDLKEQGLGEMHIFFKSKIVRAKSFYANPPPVAKMRLNQFLKIDKPSTRKLIEFEERLHRVAELVESGDLTLSEIETSSEIKLIADTIKNDSAPTLIERGVAALIAYHDKKAALFETDFEEISAEEEEQISEDSLDVFTKVKLPDLTKEMISEDELPNFGAVLLRKAQCAQQLEYVVRLFGKSDQQAAGITQELIKDMQLATNYPPMIHDISEPSEIVQLTQELIASLQEGEESDDEWSDEEEFDDEEFGEEESDEEESDEKGGRS
ncbi:MAG: TraM recognition domain-containing protein [Gammaproteobacteria bacterium]|jgi:intracellular multiplication protein IcmO